MTSTKRSRRKFILESAAPFLGTLMLGSFSPLLKSPSAKRFKVTFTLEMPEADLEEFETLRKNFENVNTLRSLNQRYLDEGKLLFTQASNGTSTKIWTYVFDSRSSFLSWKATVDKYELVEESKLPEHWVRKVETQPT